MQKNPDQVGTLWKKAGTGKGAGRFFWGGDFFDVGHGMTVELVPFRHEKQDGTVYEGVNVVKIADSEPIPETNEHL